MIRKIQLEINSPGPLRMSLHLGRRVGTKVILMPLITRKSKGSYFYLKMMNIGWFLMGMFQPHSMKIYKRHTLKIGPFGGEREIAAPLTFILSNRTRCFCAVRSF